MPSPRKSTIVLSVLLVLTSVSTAVLGTLLYRFDSDATQIRHKAWRSCRKLSMQHLLFHQAKVRARRGGRKLVVIGNPSGGFVNKVVSVYGCGDICIDINGCAPCPATTRVMKMDALVALRRLPTDSAVVFESETFEYVTDMGSVVKELDRITGKDHGRIFAVHSISIDHWRYHISGIRPQVPTRAVRGKRRKHRTKYAKTGEGSARRIIYRFPPRDRYRWVDL